MAAKDDLGKLSQKYNKVLYSSFPPDRQEAINNMKRVKVQVLGELYKVKNMVTIMEKWKDTKSAGKKYEALKELGTMLKVPPNKNPRTYELLVLKKFKETRKAAQKSTLSKLAADSLVKKLMDETASKEIVQDLICKANGLARACAWYICPTGFIKIASAINLSGNSTAICCEKVGIHGKAKKKQMKKTSAVAKTKAELANSGANNKPKDRVSKGGVSGMLVQMEESTHQAAGETYPGKPEAVKQLEKIQERLKTAQSELATISEVTERLKESEPEERPKNEELLGASLEVIEQNGMRDKALHQQETAKPEKMEKKNGLFKTCTFFVCPLGVKLKKNPEQILGDSAEVCCAKETAKPDKKETAEPDKKEETAKAEKKKTCTFFVCPIGLKLKKNPEQIFGNCAGACCTEVDLKAAAKPEVDLKAAAKPEVDLKAAAKPEVDLNAAAKPEVDLNTAANPEANGRNKSKKKVKGKGKGRGKRMKKNSTAVGENSSENSTAVGENSSEEPAPVAKTKSENPTDVAKTKSEAKQMKKWHQDAKDKKAFKKLAKYKKKEKKLKVSQEQAQIEAARKEVSDGAGDYYSQKSALAETNVVPKATGQEALDRKDKPDPITQL
eukprot:TRINITY_DN34688_c0_g1_i3.p1 TRINITY_DN34688_c0_g1~~TRINITY_DN34688_c0_g1_i3.p1  ORF type:complete len:693 (+),score=155.83 TRINITY_DN34688_c0_g1_i3:239-2080(+)